MNAEQKKIALECIRLWGSEDLSDCAGDQMAALLQELVDAPEPEPVAWRYEDAFGTHFTEDYSEISNIPGVLSFTALFAAPPHQYEHHLEMVNTPAPSVPDGHVHVHVSGSTGSGKSAVAGEIEIAMRAIGLDVEWVDSESEKHITHADYTSALELYRPKVSIFEKNISRTAPPALADVVRDAERYRWLREKNAELGRGFYVGDDTDKEPGDITWIGSDLDAAIDAAIERQGGQS